MAKLISVKTAKGRVAFSQPQGGRQIPQDRFISLPESSWLRSRIAAGDIEQQASVQSKPTRGRPKRSNGDVSPLPYETTEASSDTIETA